MKTQKKILETLKQDSRNLGFDQVGVVSAKFEPEIADNLRKFTELGHHGTMAWLLETIERRANPQLLWPEAKSIIVLATNYGPESDPLDALELHDRGTISVYARHRDYHDVMKGKLKTLASKLVSRARNLALDCDVKVFVDTAPVMEKPLAQQAGLGWQGKHTNLVSREFGSWLFLGSIFTTLELPTNEREFDHCGSCQNCLDICPTNAFTAPYKIDARRCISYLTIEHKGPIPIELRKQMGNRIYGCDDCLSVCPWNKFARTASEQKLAARDEPLDNRLASFLTLDDAAFRKLFSGSPVKRIGRNKFMQNCLIAAGNSGDRNLLHLIEVLLHDEDLLVQEAAHWAKTSLEEIAK